MKITPPPTPHRAPTAVGGDLSGSTATPVVSGLGGTPLDTDDADDGPDARVRRHELGADDADSGAVAADDEGRPASATSTVDARVPVGTNGHPRAHGRQR